MSTARKVIGLLLGLAAVVVLIIVVVWFCSGAIGLFASLAGTDREIFNQFAEDCVDHNGKFYTRDQWIALSHDRTFKDAIHCHKNAQWHRDPPSYIPSLKTPPPASGGTIEVNGYNPD